MADTGWLTASNARNVDTGDGAWSTVDNCKVSDDNEANAAVGTGSYTDRLNPYTFGANIPVGSTILGIELKIERRSQFASRYKDEDVYLMNDTTPKGNDKADTDIYWPFTEAWKTYGSDSDLWGASWTPAQINASTFGASVRCKCHNASCTIHVDCMQVKIYYSIHSTDHLMIMGM